MATERLRRPSLLVIFLYFLSCTPSSEENQHTSATSDAFQYDKIQYFDNLPIEEPDCIDSIIVLCDKVEAYNWNGTESNSANSLHHMIDAYGVFSKSAEKKSELTPQQIKELNNILSDSSSYGDFMPSCFIPHIAFVYYKDEKIIGQTNVCFLCSSVKSVPRVEGELTEKATNDLKKFCKSLGLEVYDDHDQLPPP